MGPIVAEVGVGDSRRGFVLHSKACTVVVGRQGAHGPQPHSVLIRAPPVHS